MWMNVRVYSLFIKNKFTLLRFILQKCRPTLPIVLNVLESIISGVKFLYYKNVLYLVCIQTSDHTMLTMNEFTKINLVEYNIIFVDCLVGFELGELFGRETLSTDCLSTVIDFPSLLNKWSFLLNVSY